ncbi:hypothetical protein PR048_029214 [Dryococelus australis]|uniref:Uncharacterized protein n=1 Tax=Dryococelus australis TaxID=614101 RepID=A0ABQ9GD44_9NEOP|nr:hypothetical protein PR048_029214 [Dryococelus australis]
MQGRKETEMPRENPLAKVDARHVSPRVETRGNPAGNRTRVTVGWSRKCGETRDCSSKLRAAYILVDIVPVYDEGPNIACLSIPTRVIAIKIDVRLAGREHFLPHSTRCVGRRGRTIVTRWERNFTGEKFYSNKFQGRKYGLCEVSPVPWDELFVPLLSLRAAVAERLARFPSTKASRVRSTVGSPDFRKWESCRTMPLDGGSSRGSAASPAPSFQRRSILTSITLIDSQDLAVKSRPDLFTHSSALGIFSPDYGLITPKTAPSSPVKVTPLNFPRLSTHSRQPATCALVSGNVDFQTHPSRGDALLSYPDRYAAYIRGTEYRVHSVEEALQHDASCKRLCSAAVGPQDSRVYVFSVSQTLAVRPLSTGMTTESTEMRAPTGFTGTARVFPSTSTEIHVLCTKALG